MVSIRIMPEKSCCWVLIFVGKYCYDLAQDNNITLDEFYKWNPGVGDDCQYLQSGYVYCV